MSVLPVSAHVKWVGALDPDLVTFDIVMETRYGTTYNSYFIDAEKKAVVETVKSSFGEEYIGKLKTLTNLSEIEYIIVDHTEPDHSGSVKLLLEYAPGATVVGSGQALTNLQEMMGMSFKSLKVKDGDELSLGNMTLQFIGAPNLHWPDTVYTYLKEEKVLFTCDSFGAHYCHQSMYDDQVGNYEDSFRYYFDVILKPFSKFMLKAIDKIRKLDIAVICPGHGPILRSNWKKAIETSERISREYLASIEPNRHRVLIAYVSAYGYTREMADLLGKAIHSAVDADIDTVDLEAANAGELEEKIVRSTAILIGSPTINQNTLLPVYSMLALINPIRDKGKLGASFGSYGWSGEAVKIIDSGMKSLKLDVPLEGVAAKFFPHEDKAERLKEFGQKIGALLKERKVLNEAE